MRGWKSYVIGKQILFLESRKSSDGSLAIFFLCSVEARQKLRKRVCIIVGEPHSQTVFQRLCYNLRREITKSHARSKLSRRMVWFCKICHVPIVFIIFSTTNGWWLCSNNEHTVFCKSPWNLATSKATLGKGGALAVGVFSVRKNYVSTKIQLGAARQLKIKIYIEFSQKLITLVL